MATLLLSVTERGQATIGRDSVDEGTFWALAPRYAAHDLLLRGQPATAEEIVGSHSTWAKRLGAGAGGRPGWFSSSAPRWGSRASCLELAATLTLGNAATREKLEDCHADSTVRGAPGADDRQVGIASAERAGRRSLAYDPGRGCPGAKNS